MLFYTYGFCCVRTCQPGLRVTRRILFKLMSESGLVQGHERVTRPPSVTLYPVGEEAVLYDRLRDRVVAIQAVARLLWERADGTATLEAIGRNISRRYDIEPQLALEQLRRIASALVENKLLLRDGASASEPEEIRIAYGSHQVLISTNDASLAAAVRRLFRAMLAEAEEAPGVEPIGVLRAHAHSGQYHVHGARFHRVEGGSMLDALRSLKHEVVLRFIEARPDLAWLHAGAVARGDAALLLVGGWGSGKSTAVTALYHAGWRYLSDDIVPYDPDRGCVLPFPLTPAYRDGAGKPGAEEKPLPQGAVTRLPKTQVELDRRRIQEGPASVWAIAFPAYEPGEAAGVRDYPAAEAAVGLVENCENVAQQRGDAVQALCALADRVPSVGLVYTTETDIKDAVESML